MKFRFQSEIQELWIQKEAGKQSRRKSRKSSHGGVEKKVLQSRVCIAASEGNVCFLVSLVVVAASSILERELENGKRREEEEMVAGPLLLGSAMCVASQPRKWAGLRRGK